MMIWVGMCETMGIQNENKVWGMRVISIWAGLGAKLEFWDAVTWTACLNLTKFMQTHKVWST